MRRAREMATFGAALALAAPGLAQLKPVTQTGSLIPTKPVALDPGRAARVEYNFAQCIYRRNPRAAAAMLMHGDQLSSDLPGAGIKSLSTTFGMEGCLGQEVGSTELELGLRMPARRVRTMLIEQAYLAGRRQPPKLPDGAAQDLPHDYVSTGDELPTARGLAAFSDCVVFHDVVKADALLRTMPGSPAEHAAATALAPVMGACLVQGQQVSLNVRSIRAMVADGLWSRFARPASAQ